MPIPSRCGSLWSRAIWWQVLSGLVLGLNSMTASEMALGRPKTLPPAWRTGKVKEDAELRRQRRPSWQPRVALGIGVGFPEIIPFEAMLLFHRYFAVRAFASLPLPLRVRVEMPADAISTSRDIGVAHPDLTLRFQTVWGPHLGLEAYMFPWGKSFFVFGGVSRRDFTLEGETQSPLLLCSLIELAKEPPCGDPDARIETETELRLTASASARSISWRSGVGWLWDVGRTGYLNFHVGIAKPFLTQESVDVDAEVVAPSGSSADIVGALAEVREEKEAEMAEKAKQEVRPALRRWLPILLLTWGIRI